MGEFHGGVPACFRLINDVLRHGEQALLHPVLDWGGCNRGSEWRDQGPGADSNPSVLPFHFRRLVTNSRDNVQLEEVEQFRRDESVAAGNSTGAIHPTSCPNQTPVSTGVFGCEDALGDTGVYGYRNLPNPIA